MLFAKCLLHCVKDILSGIINPAVGFALVGAVQYAVSIIVVDARLFIFGLFKSLTFLRDGQPVLPVYLIPGIL